jgi:alpha-tubulin suppressor-like RCC1 family protein
MNLLKKSSFMMMLLTVITVMLLLTGCGVQSESVRDSNGSLNLESLQKAISPEYIVAVAAGGTHTLALTSDGRVFGTGFTEGLGINSTSISTSNWVYTGMDNVKAIACDNFFSLVLRSGKYDGDVWSTGRNNYGQLALGDTSFNHLKWEKTGAVNVTAIAAGQDFSLIITDYFGQGTVCGAGSNQYGQLGLSKWSYKVWTPTNADKATAIAAGAYHSLCIRNTSTGSGQVWSTGRNNCGQLALDNNYTDVNTWSFTNSQNVTAIAAGQYHSVCICTGTVCVSGLNHVGQLGLGNYTQVYTTWQNTQQHGVSAISSGCDHTMFLRNGVVFVTGYNRLGQLALGKDANFSTNIFNMTNCGGVSSIAAGGYDSFYLANGGIFAAGKNDYGQLGIGNYVNPVNFWVHCP